MRERARPETTDEIDVEAAPGSGDWFDAGGFWWILGESFI
jgi:hypothetical protein